MVEKKLMIRLLGGIQVEYNDICIGIDNSTGKSKKMWALFEYLVINYNRNVPQSELIDILWPNEEVSNPANSLKVLAFKLRRELDRLEEVRGSEIILSVHGAYTFNDQLPHEIDVLNFDSIIKKVKTTDDKDEKLELLIKALDCFKGSVLTDIHRSPWSISFQTHYNELYKEVCRDVCEILMENQNYDTVINICKRALLIQPFEENNYYFLVRAYAALENYNAASEIYNQVKTIMQKEYGTTPNKKFEGAYKEILKDKPKNNLKVDQLTEILEEKTNYLTSFKVEYGEFKQIYRYVARRLERLENGAYMCLYTLGARKGVTITPEDKVRNTEILENALSFSLRQGDVFTRATANQFAAIFIDITEENAVSISSRITNYFKKNRKSKDFGIIHTLAVINPSEFEKRVKK